ITDEQATDPAYWASHLRGTVNFADGAGELLRDPARVFVEVGPGRSLARFVRLHPEAAGQRVVVGSLRHRDEEVGDLRFLLRSAGRLWTAGVPLEWSAFAGGARRRVPLPTYPFERRSYGPRKAVTSTPVPQPMTEPHLPGARPRRERIAEGLAAVLARSLGVSPEEARGSATFLEMGADSLQLMQLSRLVEDRFAATIPFRTLLGELSTVEALAAHLDGILPADAFPDPEAAAPPAVPQMAVPQPAAAPLFADAPPAESAVERVIQEQLKVMTAQLELMRGGTPAPVAPVAVTPAAVTGAVPAVLATPPAGAEPLAFGPHRPVQTGGAGLSAEQQAHLDTLVARYTARTAGSKRIAQANRTVLADPRAAAGFRLAWKELTYPIVAERSRGTRIWDVDGNEYLDYTMGFGVHLFGHSPAMVTRAVEEQLRKGVQLGPQAELAGVVAARICEFTGAERVAFCNTGTEAVMAAMRIARTVTGRSRVAIFAGSYHGGADGVLARARADGTSVPVAPGIPAAMVGDVLVLEWGDPRSLDRLREHGHELAAVLVEPVQSRRPDFLPADFVKELRVITAGCGAALIFDEIITGFRVHPRGMQGWYGVHADLATYGKVVGGGLPLGFVAGSARYLDAVDGGFWSFGDGSYPQATQTFFAGTFSKNPLVMAAAHAVLTHLAERGPALQETLNDRTGRLVERVRRVLDEEGVPVRVSHFASFFRFEFAPTARNLDLLFFHMLERGIYVWEGRACFVSTAHTDDDDDRFVDALRGSIADLRGGGFLPAGGGPSARAPLTLPLTPAQRQVWVHARMDDEASLAYNETVALRMRGPLDAGALRSAVRRVVERHEALRTTFDPAGEEQRVAPALEVPVEEEDARLAYARDGEGATREILEHEARRPFDLAAGPLLRVRLARLADDDHLFVVCVHHIVVDGHSAAVLVGELRELYSAAARGREPR
ncbi:MAG TPA: aminotransferase class III-fold pyridoxal phosphate-dependent enzyme, partial [Longimicrobium sp.]|nr:aminotransferase class III-fold pyridoxal phosphate-dependent enzyme [Longimicrobium sp.]